MIRYQLKCAGDHEFEAWFANSASYDEQRAGSQLVCPICGTDRVEKALMAPSIVSSRQSRPSPNSEADSGSHSPPAAAPQAAPASNNAPPVPPEKLVAFMREVKNLVRKHADYVGPRFAEEALKIHHEESDPRNIYGEATREEVQELQEEGVDVCPLPTLPEEHN